MQSISRSGGIATNPSSEAYGDTHYYSETTNLWQDATYQIPRCASEFGVQSLPLLDTLAEWIPKDQLHYGSESMTKRQHHPGGVINLMRMTFQHFDLPKTVPSTCPDTIDAFGCDAAMKSQEFLNDFTLLTQIHQAVAVQTQIEHYRSWRSRFNEAGLGNTMCAMYWQLNDIWAAPAWSSIDYNLNWKALHYYIRKAFAPLIVSMYVDTTGELRIFIVSDLVEKVQNAKLKVEVYVLGAAGYDPIYSEEVPLAEITPLASTEVEIPTDRLPVALKHEPNATRKEGDAQLLVRAKLIGSGGNAPEAYLLPNKLRTRTANYGKVVVKGVERLGEVYEVTVQAQEGVVPFAWMDLSREVKDDAALLYYWSDNGFPLVSGEPISVNLTIYHQGKGQRTIDERDIVVRYL